MPEDLLEILLHGAMILRQPSTLYLREILSDNSVDGRRGPDSPFGTIN